MEGRPGAMFEWASLAITWAGIVVPRSRRTYRSSPRRL